MLTYDCDLATTLSEQTDVRSTQRHLRCRSYDVLSVQNYYCAVRISHLACFVDCTDIAETGCLTLLEILEIYWNYFSSWKSTGNLQQSLLEIFWFSSQVRVFVFSISYTYCISECISTECLAFSCKCKCNCYQWLDDMW